MRDFKIEKGTLRDILDFDQIGVGRAKSHLQKNFTKYFFIYGFKYVNLTNFWLLPYGSHMGLVEMEQIGMIAI